MTLDLPTILKRAKGATRRKPRSPLVQRHWPKWLIDMIDEQFRLKRPNRWPLRRGRDHE